MSNESSSPRWPVYAKSSLFLAPGVIALYFCAVFLIPRIVEIWDHAGVRSGFGPSFLHSTILVLQNGFMVLAAIGLTLFLLEWRSAWWRKYRTAVLTGATILLNSAILTTLTVLLTVTLLAVPALLR